MDDGGLPAVYAFISYGDGDAAAADEVQAALERGSTQVGPGDDWRSVIRQTISGEALAFLACFSRTSLLTEGQRCLRR